MNKAIHLLLCIFTILAAVDSKFTNMARNADNEDEDDGDKHDNALDSDNKADSSKDSDGVKDAKDDAGKANSRSNGNEDKDANMYKNNYSLENKLADAPNPEDESCWLKLNANRFCTVMDKLDSRYTSVRTEYHKAVGIESFDKKMLKQMLATRAMALRAIHNANGDRGAIPAGINLGGYCMMRMSDSILFFHRMKLRNSTIFRVNHLHTDLENMVLFARLSLNDLHLMGSYERAITGKDPSNLIYKPTFGQIEFLLKDVQYKMEGRYRLLQNKLVIEVTISSILVQDVVMTYINGSTDHPHRLHSKNVDEYIGRLKVDLDLWLKDYFNDYLAFVELPEASSLAKFQQYDKEKAMILNNYADQSIDELKQKLRRLRAVALKVPKFTIYTPSGMTLKLKDGVLRGLDSMHRRSVATTKNEDKYRVVDLIIGFSRLKLEYKYECVVRLGTPPLTGTFILSADELTAHMSMALIPEPETVNLVFEFLQQTKPESLTVEGALNKRIANFKHLLENHILSLMSNTLVFHLRMLHSLSKCDKDSILPGYIDDGEIFSNESKENTTPRSEDDSSGDDDRRTTPGDSGSDEDNKRITPDDSLSTEDDSTTPNSRSDEDDKTTTPRSHEDDKSEEGPNPRKKEKMEYGVDRVDSIELVLPSQPGLSSKKMRIKYNEKLDISEVKRKMKK